MVKPQNTPCPHSRSSRRGFALLITIVLMAFLVLIMVSFSALTRVEIQIATNYQQQDVARQNALTALNIALGQLQAAAGPDQRITARAEILDSDPATPAVENVNQPHWTGVWQTGNAGLDSSNSGIAAQRETSLGNTSPTAANKSAKATWLVSMPSATTVVDPITGPSGATVTLASQIGATPTDVKVPLVDLTATAPATGSTTVGRYAYWVADEGVKAKVNLVAPTLDAAASPTSKQTHFLAPQAHALHKIAGLTTSAVTDFRTANTPDQLNKVITLNSVMFLPTTPPGLNLKTYLPDLTAYSQGVLADVKNGGLKKDLTAAMETGSEYNKLTTRYGYGSAKYPMLYADHSTLTVPYTGATATPYTTFNAIGLPWLNLYAYYNLYKSALPAAPGMTVATTNGPLGTSGSLTALPYIIKPRVITQVEGGTKVFHDSLVPEMVVARMDIALDSVLESGQYKLILRYYPQLVLHNPYNCRISATNYQFSKAMGAFMQDDGATNSSVSIRVFVGGTEITTEDIPLNQGGNRLFFLRNKAGECDTMEPGETRVFGLTAHSKIATGLPGGSAPMQNAIYGNNLLQSAAQTDEFSQWCYLPTASGGTSAAGTKFDNGTKAYAGTASANDLVTVTLKFGNKLVSSDSEQFAYRNYVNPTNNNASDFLWPHTFGTGSNRTKLTRGISVSNPQPAWNPITIGSLRNNPRILAGFVQRKKGLLPSGASSYVNGGLVTPVFHGNAPLLGPLEGPLTNLWQEYYINQFGTPYAGSSEIFIWPAGGKAITHYGQSSAGDGSGPPKNIVLRDVPGQPLISLGQFMHMATGTNSEGQSKTWPTAYSQRDTGSMFIGGSLCNPFVPTSANAQNYTAGGVNMDVAQLMLDDSYLANDTLFDRFFLSTLPPATLTSPTVEWSNFNAANSGANLTDASQPLPNSRIKPYHKNGVAPAMAELRDLDTAAANLLLDGAFNVNSTSVNAWKALLGSLSGQDMQVYKASVGAAASVDKALLANLIPRFWAASANGEVNKAWEGNRALSDTELTDLATQIVQQVKLRGPFLSMSDFLNRRLGPDSALTRMGCLQAAIDNTTINDAIKSAGAPVTLQNGDTGLRINYGSNNNTKVGPAIVGSNLKDGKGNTLNSTVGMPGYLMQQDIVQAFSPAMTVRSDTFVIRTYGEGVNPATGQTQGKAWAEAVVQRVPDFVDPADTALATLGAATDLTLLNSNNTNFGRRFKIIGFRWLSTNDL